MLAAPGFQPLSHSRLWTHLENTRAALRSFGLQPGDTIALVTRAGPESFSAFLAIAGEFACAPLSPAFTETEFRTYLARLRARALLVQDGLAPQAVTIARELGMGVARISTQPHHAAANSWWSPSKCRRRTGLPAGIRSTPSFSSTRPPPPAAHSLESPGTRQE